jgi:cardiolipin synthase
VQAVTLSYAEEMMHKGVRVLLFNRGIMHQKVLLVDETICALGTMNIDYRAIFLNFETTIICHSIDFNRQVAEMLESDFGKSLNLANARGKLGFLANRLAGNLGRVLAPLL